MSIATLVTEVSDRLGSGQMIELTAWDDLSGGTPAINTTRQTKAVTDAVARIQREAGLAEPSDTSTPIYACFVELVVLGVEYYLLSYRSRRSPETKQALDEFMEACKSQRERGFFGVYSNSPVTVANEDDVERKARFAPSMFNDRRLGRANTRDGLDADEGV